MTVWSKSSITKTTGEENVAVTDFLTETETEKILELKLSNLEKIETTK